MTKSVSVREVRLDDNKMIKKKASMIPAWWSLQEQFPSEGETSDVG